MAEHITRMRRIDLADFLPEEVVLQKDLNNPFPGPGNHPEPYRIQYIAFAHLQPVLQKERLQASPLVVHTPRGWGLVWRWWRQSVGVILMKQVGDEWAVEDKVTFLAPKEYELIRLDLTKIMINPPKW